MLRWPVKLDDKDKQLIALLQLDARTPVAKLARSVHLARSTVQERIKRLEDSGAIEGYRAILGAKVKQQPNIRARVAIKARAPEQNNLIKILCEMPTVITCESISGHWDLLLEIHTESTDQLEDFVDTISQQKGVEETESTIILKQFFTRHNPYHN